MQRTLNQIIQTLRLFATNNAQVNSFGIGFKTDLNSSVGNNSMLPILFTEYNNISLLENIKSYNFRIYCLDVKQKDNGNSQDILSDTSQILTDLRKWLIFNSENNNIEWVLNSSSNNLTPVNNFTNYLLVGYYMDITIGTNLIESDCDIPFYKYICSTPYVTVGYVTHGYTKCENN